VSLQDEDLLDNLVNYGPLVTTMQVYQDFYSYKSGIYSYVSGSLPGGHGVTVVGYDDANQCFMAKNTWGKSWGENGFFRIAYSQLYNTVKFGEWTIAYGNAIAQPFPPPGPPPPVSRKSDPTPINRLLLN
jgi:C1A family cysteine protease